MQGSKFLNLASSMVFACVLISVVFFMSTIAVTAIKGRTYDVEYTTNLHETEWKKVIDTTISGDKLIYLAENYGEEAFIRIVLPTCKEGFFLYDSVRDIDSICYINPDNSFYCTAIWIDNVVVGLNCRQVGQYDDTVPISSIEKYQSLTKSIQQICDLYKNDVAIAKANGEMEYGSSTDETEKYVYISGLVKSLQNMFDGGENYGT